MTLLSREINPNDIPEMEVRPLDAEECEAGGLSPGEAIRLSVEGSEAAFALELGGEPLCLWGYRSRSLLGGVVDMWLMSSPLVERHQIAFGRETFRVCSSLLDIWGTIEVVVWEGHFVAKRWLQWLGFELAGVEWVNGGKFLLMRKERD